jgi:hypothetical protein
MIISYIENRLSSRTMINGFLAGNQGVYYPAIIDSNDVTKIYSPNENFAIIGSEK